MAQPARNRNIAPEAPRLRGSSNRYSVAYRTRYCLPPSPGGGFYLNTMRQTTCLTVRYNKLLPVVCLVLSIAAHGLAGIAVERSGPQQFGPPVTEPAVTLVELHRPPATSSQPTAAPQATTVAAKPADINRDAPSALPEASAEPTDTTTHLQPSARPEQTPPAAEQHPEPRYLHADHIFPQQQEKLAYQISLAGIPVGSAQLEASNNQGELRIQSTIRSNSFISAFYQVDDSTDTRLIKGRYLLTRIKQHEGPYVSDTGFNLMYPERKIFWVDRLRKQFTNEKLESLDTLDFVSGFYFLRLQPLKVGNKFTLRLYDGDTTTVVPVSVLRQEKLSLPGMRRADTVVVQPEFAESGFFKNNRDLLVWFTDDHDHVPVRVEATTPIGRVSAELVSSERTVVAPPATPASTVVPGTEIQYN